jgi:hypothetical protein
MKIKPDWERVLQALCTWPGFYWKHRRALWHLLTDFVPALADPTRQECELLLSETGKYRSASFQEGQWTIDVPDLCTVCGDPTETAAMESSRRAVDLRWPLLTLLSGFALGLVVGILSGQLWLIILASVLGMVVGMLKERSIAVRILSRRCPLHERRKDLPALRAAGERLVVRCGNRRVREIFLEVNDLDEADSLQLRQAVEGLLGGPPPERPRTITAASFIWIVFGALQFIGFMLVMAIAVRLAIALGPVVGIGACILFLPAFVQFRIAQAFLHTGRMALSGSLNSPLANGMASILIGLVIAAIGFHFALGDAGPPDQPRAAVQALVVIWGISCGVSALILIVAGGLAIAGNAQYEKWVRFVNRGDTSIRMAAFAAGRMSASGPMPARRPRRVYQAAVPSVVDKPSDGVALTTSATCSNCGASRPDDLQPCPSCGDLPPIPLT